MKRNVGLMVLVLSGCGAHDDGARGPTGTEHDAAAGGGVDAVLSCRAGAPEPAVQPLVMAPERPRADVGVMTREAAHAKRLFDAARWIDAAAALGRVADGTTGDDRGNQEIADYQRAVALTRMEKTTDALVIFQRIAADKAHNKWSETSLHLLRLLERPETAAGALQALAPYDGEVVARYDNADQRPMFMLFQMAFGRLAYLARDYPRAQAHFARVDATSPWHDAAEECIEMMRARSG